MHEQFRDRVWERYSPAVFHAAFRKYLAGVFDRDPICDTDCRGANDQRPPSFDRSERILWNSFALERFFGDAANEQTEIHPYNAATVTRELARYFVSGLSAGERPESKPPQSPERPEHLRGGRSQVPDARAFTSGVQWYFAWEKFAFLTTKLGFPPHIETSLITAHAVMENPEAGRVAAVKQLLKTVVAVVNAHVPREAQLHDDVGHRLEQLLKAGAGPTALGAFVHSAMDAASVRWAQANPELVTLKTLDATDAALGVLTEVGCRDDFLRELRANAARRATIARSQVIAGVTEQIVPLFQLPALTVPAGVGHDPTTRTYLRTGRNLGFT